MKVLVLGVVRMHGVSMKSGTPKPYDMTRIMYAVPVAPIEAANRTLLGHGYESKDLDLDPLCLPAFKDVQFPKVLDLDVQPNPSDLRRNLCQGIRASGVSA
jgi:hypothetical protein